MDDKYNYRHELQLIKKFIVRDFNLFTKTIDLFSDKKCMVFVVSIHTLYVFFVLRQVSISKGIGVIWFVDNFIFCSEPWKLNVV